MNLTIAIVTQFALAAMEQVHDAEGRFNYGHMVHDGAYIPLLPEDMGDTVSYSCPMNYAEGTASRLAVSLALAVIAYNRVCWDAHANGSEHIMEVAAMRQYAVRDYALDTLKGNDLSAFLSIID